MFLAITTAAPAARIIGASAIVIPVDGFPAGMPLESVEVPFEILSDELSKEAFVSSGEFELSVSLDILELLESDKVGSEIEGELTELSLLGGVGEGSEEVNLGIDSPSVTILSQSKQYVSPV